MKWVSEIFGLQRDWTFYSFGGSNVIQAWNLSFTKPNLYRWPFGGSWATKWSNLEPFIDQSYIVHPLNFHFYHCAPSTTLSVRNLHTLKHISVETRQAIPHFLTWIVQQMEDFLSFWIKKVSIWEGFWRRLWDCMKQSQLTWVREGIKK